LKLLNFILTVTGLAIVGYGIYLLVGFTKASDDDTPDISPTPEISPVSGDTALIQLGRPMLMAVSLSDNIFHKLPKAWYAYCSFPVIFGAYHCVRLGVSLITSVTRKRFCFLLYFAASVCNVLSSLTLV